MLLGSMETEYFLNWINPAYISGKCGLSPSLVPQADVGLGVSENDILTFKSFLDMDLAVQASSRI